MTRVPVLFDTSVIVPLLRESDPLREPARELLRQASSGAYGIPLVPDHVIEETLTFVRGRGASADQLERVHGLWWRSDGSGPRPALRPLLTDLDGLRLAAGLQMRFHDQELSLTDAILLLHAQRMGAKVATFDAALASLVEALPGA